MGSHLLQIQFTFQYGEIKSRILRFTGDELPYIYIPVWRD